MNLPATSCAASHLCLSAVLLLLGSEAGWACRYNVRDLGFIDVGDSVYHLYFYPQPGMSTGQLDRVVEVAGASLAESNIEFVLCQPDGGPAPESKAALEAHPNLSLPGGVLSSPDGQSLPVSLSIGQPGWEAGLRAQLHSLAVSPKREAITRGTAQAFAVVLFLEGTDPELTRRARTEILGAMEQTRNSMAWMPKAIARPPEMIVLEPEAQRSESVLMWSLDQEPETTAEPRAAVIYGRSRWMGPIARGIEITEDNLARLLGIIGIDCECGMDLGWTRGTRLPVRWGQALYRQVAESLGFDPENPMVKIEAGRILSRYGGLVRPTIGYSEISLGGDEPSSSALAPVEIPAPEPGVSLAAGPPAPGPGPDDPAKASMIRRLVMIGGGFCALVLAFASVILWRAWRQGHLKL